MNTKFNLAILFAVAAFSFPLNFDLFASETNQNISKIELIEEDLEKSRNDILNYEKLLKKRL